MRIKQGDTVIVIAGNDKGETGEVTQVFSGQNRIVVAGVNRRTKHQKPRQAGRTQVQGGIVEFEAPINVSNVMLVCPHTGEPTRVGVRRDENGKPVRFSKKSGQDI
ncbi:MAG: 50S ribosomal protein L24 [Anaerolineae bacterium]